MFALSAFKLVKSAVPMTRLFNASAFDLARATGTVKWFDPTKGFGFITDASTQSDIFVHQSNIHSTGFRALTEGEQVEFDIEDQGGGKRKAGNVTGPGGVDIVPPAKNYDERW